MTKKCTCVFCLGGGLGNAAPRLGNGFGNATPRLGNHFRNNSRVGRPRWLAGPTTHQPRPNRELPGADGRLSGSCWEGGYLGTGAAAGRLSGNCLGCREAARELPGVAGRLSGSCRELPGGCPGAAGRCVREIPGIAGRLSGSCRELRELRRA